MLKFIARRYAKAAYVFRQEVEAETNLLNAGLALRTAAEKRSLAKQLTEQADQMDARIKEVSEMEEKGYWLCDDGHERSDVPQRKAIIGKSANGIDIQGPVCDCGKPGKFIIRDLMTGQEKYESDRERKDAEDLAKQKRDQAKAEEENAANSEKAAQYFKGIAQQTRGVAEKLKRL